MAGSRGKGPGLKKEGDKSVRNQGGIFKGFMSRNLGRLRSTVPDTFPPG